MPGKRGIGTREATKTGCGADQVSCETANGFGSLASCFLRHKLRWKDGKEHRYRSIVENRRVSGGRTEQRHVLYLGEINDSQRTARCQTIEAFDEKRQDGKQIALFPEDRTAPARTWVMDRGIPTEEVLAEMRASETPMRYLVGTPPSVPMKMRHPPRGI